METIKIFYLAFSVLLQVILLFIAVRSINLMLSNRYGWLDKIFVIGVIVLSLSFFVGLSGNQLATVSGNLELVVTLALTAMGCVAVICLLSYFYKKRLGF